MWLVIKLVYQRKLATGGVVSFPPTDGKYSCSEGSKVDPWCRFAERSRHSVCFSEQLSIIASR